MKYSISGADEKTGDDVRFELEADTERDAVKVARQRGVFVSEIHVANSQAVTGSPPATSTSITGRGPRVIETTMSSGKLFLIVCGGVVCAALILMVGFYILQVFASHGPAVSQSAKITDEDVQPLVGVNYYVGTEIGAIQSLGGLTVLGTDKTVQLLAGTQVKVARIVFDETSFPHPAKSYEGVIEDEYGPMQSGYVRYRIYIKSPSSVDTLLLHPAVRKSHGHLEWDAMPICPVDKFDAARSQLLGKSVTWKGQKIGSIEVEPGTVMKVVDVSPYNLVYVELTLQLPSGKTETTISRIDGAGSDFVLQ